MNEYNPDIVSAPGETLQELLEEREISPADFAVQLGISAELLAEIFERNAPITPEIAQGIERLLGSPARFWLAREQHYREHLAQKTPS